MYTATRREITKFMRSIDMEIPRPLPRIICLLRNSHKDYWFDEDKVLYTLNKLHATCIHGEPTYYYIKHWEMRSETK